jgi:hypothetical protein
MAGKQITSKDKRPMADSGPEETPLRAQGDWPNDRPLLVRFREMQEQVAFGLPEKGKRFAQNDPPPLLKAAAAEVLAMRRRRERLLPPELADGPAWVMLLSAYVSPNSVMMTKELLAAAPVPQTTAMRWLQLLEREGFVQKTEHPSRCDNRATFYRLTVSGCISLEQALAAMLYE